MKKCSVFIACFALLFAAQAYGQIGDFDDHISVGDDDFMGDATYAGGTYTITGAGTDIWGTVDGFYWVYKEITGSFIITADFAWTDPDLGDDFKKGGLMVRTDPEDPSSVFVIALLRKDLAAYLQYRPEAGTNGLDGPTATKSANDTDTIRLMRVKNSFSMMRKQTDGSFKAVGGLSVDLPETIFLGMAVTAHDVADFQTGNFSNVSIETIPVAVIAERTMPQDTFTTNTVVADIKVAVEIEAGKTTDIALQEIVPSGWEITKQQVSKGEAAIDGNTINWTWAGASGNATLTYSVRPSSETTEGVMFGGSLTSSEGNTFAITGKPGLDIEGASEALAPLLTNTVTLDGILSPGEWDGSYKETFDRTNDVPPGVWISGPFPTREESNLTFQVFHTTDYIYVSMDMVDPFLDFDSTAGDSWNNDSTELYLDGDLSRLATKDSNSYGFQATVLGNGATTAGIDPPTPEELPTGGYHSTDGEYWNYGARVKDDGSGYIAEYQVEKALCLDPLDITIVGFDIGLNDADGTGARSGKWAWWHYDVDTGSRKDAWDDERGWGTLELLNTTLPTSVDVWELY